MRRVLCLTGLAACAVIFAGSLPAMAAQKVSDAQMKALSGGNIWTCMNSNGSGCSGNSCSNNMGACTACATGQPKTCNTSTPGNCTTGNGADCARYDGVCVSGDCTQGAGGDLGGDGCGSYSTCK